MILLCINNMAYFRLTESNKLNLPSMKLGKVKL